MKAKLLDFWSPTCGPCKRLEPAIVAFVNANGHRVEAVSVNTSDPKSAALVQQHQVKTVPTLVLVKDGRVVARSTGIQPTVQAIDAWVTGAIGA